MHYEEQVRRNLNKFSQIDDEYDDWRGEIARSYNLANPPQHVSRREAPRTPISGWCLSGVVVL